MNTIKIYLTESGRIADLQKDFPLYQGQFQNKLLNVFVPTSILAPIFTSSGAVSADYVASTSTKIGMTYTARDGSIKVSKNYYMRYLKTLMYKGVEYALYERKLPKEFTFYAGQGENSPVLIINVVNIEQQSGDTPPLVLSVITSQTCHLDVMQSTFLDRDELDEPSELENLNAQVQALNALMPKKQDKEDENIALEQAPAEKTVVGAINELGGLVKTAQSSADTAQQTAETAQTTADNATTLANNAVATANGAVATANEAKTTAQTAENNANSAVDKADSAIDRANKAYEKAANNVYAVGFMTLQEAITAVNGYDNTVLKTNDNILVVAQGSPDLYVTSVEATNIPYNFTTVDKFNDDLVKNTVLQIGYYKVAFYETDGQPVTVAYQNVVVKSTDWVASTEFADFPYEAKIPLSNFVDYKTVPQVVFDIADTMSGNYAPICKSGDKCVYIYGKVQNEITLKTVITFAPNVNGASVTGGGYNNRGKWVASTTYAIDDLVYTDNGQFVCIEGITSTTSPEQDTTHWQATFVATGKTKNTLTISGQDNGTEVQKTFDGSTAVEIAFDETTMTAKEVNGVLKVGAKGTVPEALPAIGAKITGNLPTSGWASDAPFWEGSLFLKQNNDTLLLENIPTPTSNIPLTVTAFLRRGSATTPYGTVTKSNNANYNAETGEVIWYGYFTISENGYKYSNEIKLTFKDNKLYAQCTESQYNASYAAITLKSIASTEIAGVPRYTISNPAIKTNSTVSIYLNSADEIRTYSKTDGSVVVEMDAVPTVAIPYTLQVVETSAEGAFEIINSYLPTIPETPTALPQEASALTSGNLPTTGWGVNASLWTGSEIMPSYYYIKYLGNIGKSWATSQEQLAELPNGWQATMNGTLYSNRTAHLDSDSSTKGIQFGITGIGDDAEEAFVRIYTNGDIYVWNNYTSVTRTITQIGCSLLSKQTYTISDTSITANSDILMELTDKGGVKTYSMEAGSITVIRDTVPTSPIPYTYKVKQTNASGQFTLVNHFVPNVPAVPTKTSELTNDSGFVSNLPSVRNVVCNDVDSATTLDTTITCEVGDLILAQIIVRSALTLPTGWTLLRTIPAVETTNNQTLSFAYKRATSTSETLTVTQATAGRIYTNLVRLSNAASISYIQSCEKTGTGIKSISSTKPVTSNMVIWGAASNLWQTSSPYGDWTYSPSTLDYYSLPQSTKQPRLGTFVDSSGAGERTFTITVDSSNSLMCGAVEIVGDEVARKGDIPTKTSQLTNDSGFITAADIPSAGEWVTVTENSATLTEAGTYQVLFGENYGVQSIIYWDGSTGANGIPSTTASVTSSGTAIIAERYLTVAANGVLSTHITMITVKDGSWTQTTPSFSGFKYRKIN